MSIIFRCSKIQPFSSLLKFNLFPVKLFPCQPFSCQPFSMSIIFQCGKRQPFSSVEKGNLFPVYLFPCQPFSCQPFSSDPLYRQSPFKCSYYLICQLLLSLTFSQKKDHHIQILWEKNSTKFVHGMKLETLHYIVILPKKSFTSSWTYIMQSRLNRSEKYVSVRFET